MKFSDMMGKGDPDTTATEVAEVEPPANTRFQPPPPLDAHRAPSVPEADIRFGTATPAPLLPPPAPSPSPLEPPKLSPSISEVVAELAPRATTSAVTDQQLDTSSWLDGINEIDDDLLPK